MSFLKENRFTVMLLPDLVEVARSENPENYYTIGQ
jgi:hypothetical protein